MRCNCVFRLQEVRASVTKCGHTAIAPMVLGKTVKTLQCKCWLGTVLRL